MNKNDRYEKLLFSAPDPIVVLASNGSIKSLNHQAEKISGYSSSELVGHSFATAGVISALSLPKAMSEFALTLVQKERPPYEMEFIFKDGSRHPYEVHSQLIKYDDGDSEILIVLRDIEHRKKMQNALSESEQRYKTLTESAEDAIFQCRKDCRIIYANTFSASLFKAPPDQVIGKYLSEIFSEKDYLWIKKNFETVIQSKKSYHLEEKLLFPTGERWLSTKLIPILDPNGEVESITGIARDITERKTNEEKMALQSKTLEAASNGIVITDVHGVILWVNISFTNMTGYSFEEAVGKTPRILKSGEQSPELYKQLWATILAGNTWTGELINRRKDSSLYFEKQTITPVKDAENKITHFIAIKQDISSDKKLEAQFRQAQKMEAVGRLAGGVAHDFNNLLTIVLGNCDLLLSKITPESPILNYVQEIRKTGDRAANLTRQLLAFSRKQIFQIKVMDLNEIIRNTDKLLRRLLREDIEMVVILNENLKPIKVDPAQIEQVLMNLVVNARDAMPNGGKLIIETSETAVDSKTAAHYMGMIPGDYVLLKIKDTGCGIPSEVKSHLFEPFFTTKEKGKGTGLGLATVYGIVKQSRGYIYAESEVGKGTAFLVYLPPSDEKIDKKETTASSPLPRGIESILIVEDEELVRTLAFQILTHQGFQVEEASTGLEALKILSGHVSAPKLIFTDMVMPQMGGNELAENVFKKYPEMKILFTSGYSDQSVVQKWLDKGCRFIQKPYTHAELLLIIREILDKKN